MNDGLELYRGVYCRTTEPERSCDRLMANECKKNYADFMFDGSSRVLDLGANIGGLIPMLVAAGVRNYLGVEPDAGNVCVLRANVDRADTMFELSGNGGGRLGSYGYAHAAVSHSREEFLTFYTRNSNRSASSGSTNPARVTRALTPHRVTNMNFIDTMEAFKPTHLKMDIEGAEHGIFTVIRDMPMDERAHAFWSVKELAIELHGEQPIRGWEAGNGGFLEELGFELVRTSPIIGFRAKRGAPPIVKDPVYGHVVDGTLFGMDVFYRRK